jgi:hypothetical protein
MDKIQIAPMKQTPKWAKKMFYYFFCATTIIAIGVQTLPNGVVTAEQSDIINNWIIWANGIMLGVSRMFGVDTQTTLSVTESVTHEITVEKKKE